MLSISIWRQRTLLTTMSIRCWYTTSADSIDNAVMPRAGAGFLVIVRCKTKSGWSIYVIQWDVWNKIATWSERMSYKYVCHSARVWMHKFAIVARGLTKKKRWTWDWLIGDLSSQQSKKGTCICICKGYMVVIQEGVHWIKTFSGRGLAKFAGKHVVCNLWEIRVDA